MLVTASLLLPDCYYWSVTVGSLLPVCFCQFITAGLLLTVCCCRFVTAGSLMPLRYYLHYWDSLIAGPSEPFLLYKWHMTGECECLLINVSLRPKWKAGTCHIQTQQRTQLLHSHARRTHPAYSMDILLSHTWKTVPGTCIYMHKRKYPVPTLTHTNGCKRPAPAIAPASVFVRTHLPMVGPTMCIQRTNARTRVARIFVEWI